MSLTCAECDKTVRIRVWDEQDGYRDARLLGWEIAETTKCPKCSTKLLIQ